MGPGKPRGFFSGSIRRARRAARELHDEALNWLRSVRFAVHMLEGRTPGGQALSILYAGSGPYRHYLRGLAFMDSGSERALGRHWRWQLPALAARLGPDIRITRCARALRGLFAAYGAVLYAPEWLWCELVLDPKTAERTGKDWSRIRRHGLDYSVTTDAAALRLFYERMYVPLIKTSHGEAAQLMGLAYMLRRVADGEAELVSIVQRGVAVGGCFVVYDDGHARLFSQGVLDADRELLRQRVGVATYLYSFVHLLERGFGRVSLGRSRPFLADGALRFKLERGAEITAATATGIGIAIDHAGRGTSEFFCANPWVGEDDEGLVTLCFVPADAPGVPATAPRGVPRVAVVPIAEAGSTPPLPDSEPRLT